MAQLPDLAQYEIEMAELLGLDIAKVASGTIRTRPPQNVEWAQLGINEDLPVTISTPSVNGPIPHNLELTRDMYDALREVEERRKAAFAAAVEAATPRP